MLNQRIAFLEDQNLKYDNENQALRQAQIEMEERHTAEVIELKQKQLENVQLNTDPLIGDDQEDRQMLVNLVKVKDEEIKQLRHQLGDDELIGGSPARHNASPLRANKQTSPGYDGLRPINIDGQPGLEDQLAAMNQETLEE